MGKVYSLLALSHCSLVFGGISVVAVIASTFTSMASLPAPLFSLEIYFAIEIRHSRAVHACGVIVLPGWL